MQEELLDTIILEPDSFQEVFIVKEPEQISLFQSHELPATDSAEEIAIPSQGRGVSLTLILVCVIIIIYVQRNSEAYFGSLFRSAFDRNIALQESRKESSQKLRNNLLVQVVSYLSFVLFISVSINNLGGFDKTAEEILLWSGVVLFLAYWIKRILIWFLGFTFYASTLANLYRLNLNLFFSVNGLVLLPLSFLLLFSPQLPTEVLVISGLVVMTFFYLKALQRGFLMATRNSSIKLLHLFYYLCALEFLPVFALVRFGLTL